MKVASQIDDFLTLNDLPAIYEHPHTNFDRYFHFSSRFSFLCCETNSIPLVFYFCFASLSLSFLVIRKKVHDETFHPYPAI